MKLDTREAALAEIRAVKNNGKRRRLLKEMAKLERKAALGVEARERLRRRTEHQR